MIRQEFASLPESSQARIILKHGVFVGKKQCKTVNVVYQVCDFYVLIAYEDYRKKIKQVTVYENPDQVIEYIDQVPISDLLAV